MGAEIVRELLRQYGLVPNRALGQNFLIDDAAARRIADKAAGFPVLEIGSGLGALTEPLLSRSPKVVAVEIDGRMAEILRHRFGNQHLTVIRADFLKTDLTELEDMLGGEYCVAANLPYYITTPICMRLLCRRRIHSMALMVQKEAGYRFFAGPGDRVYGPMAVLSQYYFELERLMTLSPESYYPQPDVDSVVVYLKSRGAQPMPQLPALLEAAFSMRRKTLFNNLKPLLGAQDAKETLSRCGIDGGLRAEALNVEDFAAIAREIIFPGENGQISTE